MDNLIKNSAILDVGIHSFGSTETNLTMTGTSEFKTAGTGVKFKANDLYYNQTTCVVGEFNPNYGFTIRCIKI